jgi:hypothetical protein
MKKQRINTPFRHQNTAAQENLGSLESHTKHATQLPIGTYVYTQSHHLSFSYLYIMFWMFYM